jgi:hypothetical protein
VRYTWYFGQHSELERQQFGQQLRTHRIRSAFFHVRFVDKNGRLAFRYGKQANALTSGLHRDAPGVKLLAWIYAEPSVRGLHLADDKTRQAMVSEALWLTRDCGFGRSGCENDPVSFV